MAEKPVNTETGFFDWFKLSKVPAPTPTPGKNQIEDSDNDLIDKMRKGQR